MSIKTDVLIVGGVALALLGIAWYAKKKLTDTGGALVDTVAEAVPYVNPADSRNVVYGGVNAVGAAVTGDSSFSLGSWIYDMTHKSEFTP